MSDIYTEAHAFVWGYKGKARIRDTRWENKTPIERHSAVRRGERVINDLRV